MTFAGIPATTISASTLFTTTALAPTKTSLPIQIFPISIRQPVVEQVTFEKRHILYREDGTVIFDSIHKPKEEHSNIIKPNMNDILNAKMKGK
jgi:hypothetical protein